MVGATEKHADDGFKPSWSEETGSVPEPTAASHPCMSNVEAPVEPRVKAAAMIRTVGLRAFRCVMSALRARAADGSIFRGERGTDLPIVGSSKSFFPEFLSCTPR